MLRFLWILFATLFVAAPQAHAQSADAIITEVRKNVRTTAATELTLASDAVTLTKSYHTIDTQADAASDDLATLSGGVAGQTYWLCASNDARTVVVTNAGNIVTSGATSISLAEDDDCVQTFYTGSKHVVIASKVAAVTAASDGAWVEETFTGQASYALLAVPASGTNLEIELRIVCTDASAQQLYMYANGDTTAADYLVDMISTNDGGAIGGSEIAGGTIGLIPGTTGLPANAKHSISISIPDYRGAENKVARASTVGNRTTGYAEHAIVAWTKVGGTPEAAITGISFVPQAGTITGRVRYRYTQ